MKQKKKHNWELVLDDIREARRNLKRLETHIADPKKRSEDLFWIDMKKVINHLGLAWTLRFATTEERLNPTDASYKKWVKFPADFSGRMCPPRE